MDGLTERPEKFGENLSVTIVLVVYLLDWKLSTNISVKIGKWMDIDNIIINMIGCFRNDIICSFFQKGNSYESFKGTNRVNVVNNRPIICRFLDNP